MNHNSHHNFFQSGLVPNPYLDKQLLLSSESWWDGELAKKRELLQLFWQGHVVKLNQKSIGDFKQFILDCHFPKVPSWKEQIDKLFSSAVSLTISFEDFFNTLKYLPMGQIMCMGRALKFIMPALEKVQEVATEITANDLMNIQRYMVEKGMSAAIAFGSAEKTLLAPNFNGDKNTCFSIHSIGKVLTGMLTFILVRKGFIPESALNSTPILDSNVEEMLSSAVREQLKKVTLHQLMTHKAGIGNYLEGYMDAIAQGKISAGKIKNPEDFLPFAEKEVYPIGKERYSNLGILLVGLVIQHAYGKNCGYTELLKEYIVDKVGMPSFSILKPENAKVHSADFIASQMVGSPAGGFWMTAEDLAKFGQWVYKQVKADPELEILMQKYGQEFYNAETKVMAHSGAIESSSAFLSVSLQTGVVIATLSSQTDMAFDLYETVHEKLFVKHPGIIDDDSVSVSFS